MITLTPKDPAMRTPEVLAWCATVSAIIEKEFEKEICEFFTYGVSKIHKPKS